MIIDKPTSTEPLRQLWKQAFGDTDTFLDSFFSFGFSPNRSRQITVEGKVVAALYWFDCSFREKKIAYVYAVATDKDFQGQGLCRMLMEDTHRHLRNLGYGGALLVPGSKGLFQFYEKLGYHTCSHIREFTCDAAGSVALRTVSPEEYVVLRKAFLPLGGVDLEDSILRFLAEQYRFYAGEDFVLCAIPAGDMLFAPEFLGNVSAAPGIAGAFGKKQGCFRTPGNNKPFAMYYPLSCQVDAPSYFSLALD